MCVFCAGINKLCAINELKNRTMTELKFLESEKQNQSWNDVESSGMIEIISKYNLAKVLTAMHKSDLISKIKRDEIVSHKKIDGYNEYLLMHLLNYLKIHGILIKVEHGYKLSTHGKQMLSDESIAQLCFYSESYDNITSNVDQFLTENLIYGKDIERDGKSLGIHCDTLFKEYHTETVLQAIKHLDCKKILDIGCGGGQFLIDACKKNKLIEGIGLDISKPAIEYANETALKYKFQDRISFVAADAFELDSWPLECFDADVLCGSGVIHEHFRHGEEAVIKILNTYSKLLRQKGFKAIILGEPEIRHDLIKSDVDLYLVHIFTAQGFPRYREQWLELFEKTELTCKTVYTRPSAGPRFNFYVLTL
jgi:2-polyprenyl-3-methyl-5-hydroxy-6-metoxy-1,4-benzoquinol methylase